MLGNGRFLYVAAAIIMLCVLSGYVDGWWPIVAGAVLEALWLADMLYRHNLNR